MNKILLIIQREYITRVSNKRFLLMTILMPLIFVAFIAGSAYFAASSQEESQIAVVNGPEFLKENIKSDTGNVVFSFFNGNDSSMFKGQKFDALLYPEIVGDSLVAELHSSEQVGFETSRYVERQLSKSLENILLQNKGIRKAALDSISDTSEKLVVLKSMVTDEEGESKESNAGLAYGIGFGSGFLIYMTMFIFGSMVMRGVVEEKTNRIAEVIVSSCKPFELMMGKIVGIAGVGLTQLLLWIALIFALSSSLSAFIPSESVQEYQNMQENPTLAAAQGSNSAAFKILEAKDELIAGANWLTIIACFLFYFLGGYLFYASLFAAVGSVINEDPQEAQQLMLPISMPIIFAFIILGGVLDNPGSNLAVWTSIIPFTSPIIMMGRIPFGVPNTVPYWQLGLSMLSLIGGFVLTTWFAAKVYRTGILMYGKKATWKEMIRWVFA
ncbi:MAG: ABC transporter permease [Chitinophagaceae bacterium]|jgi:ABC-2 type transport system permease protein